MSAARSPYVVQAPAGISASARAATSHAGSERFSHVDGSRPLLRDPVRQIGARAWIWGAPAGLCGDLLVHGQAARGQQLALLVNELLLSFGLYPVSVRLAEGVDQALVDLVECFAGVEILASSARHSGVAVCGSTCSMVSLSGETGSLLPYDSSSHWQHELALVGSAV